MQIVIHAVTKGNPQFAGALTSTAHYTVEDIAVQLGRVDAQDVTFPSMIPELF